MNVFSTGRGMAAVAAVVFAIFLMACGGTAPTPGPYAYTPAPGPTATPIPTPTPTPTPPPPTATPLPTPTPLIPAKVAPPPAPLPATWPCQEYAGYCGAFAVGGSLLAAAWLDERRMYLADREGRIRLLDVATGDVETLVDGLSWPRGLTALDGRLYVSELGNTCQLIRELSRDDEDPSGCRVKRLNREIDFLTQVSAQILSYAIDDSGYLSDRQVVLDKIIAVDSEHAPNGLVNDGEYVYVSIAHPQGHSDADGFFMRYYDGLERLQIRVDLMGVVVRFRPPHPGDRADIEIYATGLRNVYGISIAPDGTIYGGDNDEADGLITEGHREELNAIVSGGYYGHPAWGTNVAPPEANVIEPVAVLPGVSSTYAHANADGVYVAYVYLDDAESGYVIDRFDYDAWTPQRVFDSDNIITAILERQGLLYASTYSGDIHVINPSAAPVRVRPFGKYHNDGYVDTAIAKEIPSIIPPGYEVYVDDGRVIYDKSPCAPGDTAAKFYLHLFPVNADDLPAERRPYGFDNLDFNFHEHGWQSDGVCRAVRELPGYAVAGIRTGQSVYADGEFEQLWRAEYQFPP